MLKITVGEPTLLSPMDSENHQNTASLAVSRTGVVAAFYPKPPKYCRTSTDGGLTWEQEEVMSSSLFIALYLSHDGSVLTIADHVEKQVIVVRYTE